MLIMNNRLIKASLPLLAALLLPSGLHATVITLKTGDASGTTSFTGNTNWSNGAIPSSGNDYVTVTTVVAGQSGLRTPGDALNYTFGGNSLTLSPYPAGGYSLIEKSSAGTGAGRTLIINNFTNAGGLMRGGGNVGSIITIGGNAYNVVSNATITADQCNWIIASPLVGTGILTNNFASAQTVAYSGTNTAYTGEFYVNGGILKLNSIAGAPGNPAVYNAGQITLTAGSTLQDNAGITLANGNGGVTLAGAATINNATAASNTIVAEPIIGAFALTKSGPGILTLSGSNSYTGGLVISAGQVNVNSTNAFGTGPLTFTNAPGTIDNTTGAALIDQANNAQTWGTNFTFIGTTNLNLGTGAVTLAGTARTVTVNNNNLTVGGSIGGALALTKAGSGILTLTASNTLTGGVTVSAGRLVMANPYALGTSGMTMSGTVNATLDIATDGADYTNVVNAGSASVFTIQSDVKTGSVGITHTLGTFLIGSGTPGLQMTVAAGPNVASGSPQIASAQLTLSGGSGGTTVLIPTTASLTFGGVTATATSKTLQLDGTNTLNTITGAIVNGGANVISLTKANTGTWTLGGANTYSGNTTVSNGVLALTGSGAITGSTNITVNTPGMLDVSTLSSTFTLGAAQSLAGTGTINGSAADSTGSQLVPGGSGTVGTLTFNNNLTLAGGDTMQFDFTPTNNDTIVVGGSLTPSGTVTINLASGANGLANGNYVLFLVTNNLNGSAANFTVTGQPSPSRQSFTVVYNTATSPKQVILQVAGSVGNLVWQGGLNGNLWDITTTYNWTNSGINASDVYFDGDNVSFTAAGAANPPVLNTNVHPGSVLFNSSASYTLSGNGAISGSTGLTATNTGTLTIQTTNGYTGVTTISGATVSIGYITNSGSPSPIGAATAAAANVVLNGGTLQYTGGTASTDHGATLGAGGGTVSVTTAGSTLSVGGVINGTSGGGLTASGSGTLVLGGANTYNGSTTISGATLQVGTGGATGNLGTGSSITDNGALVFLRTGTLTLTNIISGTGSLTNNGTGTLVLAATNTYTGGTVINTGLVQVVTVGGLGATPASFNPGQLTIGVGELEASTSFSLSDTNSGVTVNAGTIGVDAGVTLTISNQVVSPTSLTKALPGTLILNGSNTLSGTLNVDTGSSTASDGVVDIASTNALGGVATINIRTSQVGGSSTLQLDGTAGSVNVTPGTFTWSGRNNMIPGVENLTGSNVWNPSSVTLNVGGTYYGFQSDAGILNLAAYFPASSPATQRTIFIAGSGATYVSGGIEAGGGIINVLKTNTGSLTYWGANNYTGITSIQGGSLIAADGSSFGNSTINSTNGNIELAPWPGQVATLIISNANILAQRLIIGGITANNTSPGTGTVNQYNGTVNASQWVTVGSGGTTGGTGTYNLSGGTLNVENTPGGTQMEVANFTGSTGTLNLSGSGSVNIWNNAYLSLGANAGAGNGTVNQTGGTLTFYSDAGGTVGGAGILYLGKATGLSSNYIYNLGGGTLIVPTVTSASGNSLFYLNGGTLKAAKTNSAFVSGLTAAYVSTNTSTLDDGGYPVTIPQPLLHDPALGGVVDGGLTKQGSGVFYLNGTNTYTGQTTVTGGALGGNGVIGSPVDIQGGGVLAPGAAIGTLTVSNSLAFESGSTAQFNFGTGSNSAVTVTGALNVNGATTVSINYLSSVIAVGTYPLIQYGSLSGYANLTPPVSPNPRFTFTLTNNTAANTIALVVSGIPANLVWHGDGSGNDWDNSGGYQNWLNAGSADFFYDGDTVLFNNVGSNTPSIYLTATVSPASVTVNSTNNYDFAGSGVIAGPGALTKSGSGTLTVEDNNTYAGATIINAGTLQIGAGATTGSLGAGSVTNNAALVFDRSDAVTVANAISGSGTVSQTGSGSLILTASNSYAGPTYVSSGVLQPHNPSALGASNNLVVATGGGTLYADLNYDYPGVALTLGGAALHKGGSGETTFGGSVTLVANTTIQVDGSATLNLTSTNGISGAGDNLTLNGDGGSLGTVAGPLSLGTGGLTKGGTGIWTLSASNNFTGLTALTAGTLRITGGSLGNPAAFTANQITLGGATLETVSNAVFNDGNAGFTLTANTTLQVDSGATLTISNNISGANTLTKSSPGTLILNGSNAFSGTLNLDTASTSASDGITRLASPNALANVTAIFENNNNNGYSILQLDAGAGNLVLPQTFTLNCRNVTNSSIESLNGSNTLSGTVQIQTGGNAVYFAADSGTLNISGPIEYVGTLAGGRNYTFTGAGNHLVNGAITSGINAAAPIGITMNGSGTLTLAAANTYPNTTTINSGLLLLTGSITSTGGVSVVGGTLGGNGTITDTVSVGTGGTLWPGAAGLGTLTITSNLTLAGTTHITVNKTASTSDVVTGVASLTYGGTLYASNISGTLNVGDSFTVFSAASKSGNFASVTGSPGAGKAWSFNPATGVLSVILGVNTTPTNITAVVTGTNYSLSWPADHIGWRLQVQTNNLSSGISANTNDWGTVTGSAATNLVTVPIDPAKPGEYYRMVYP